MLRTRIVFQLEDSLLDVMETNHKYNKFLLVDALLVVLERTSCVDCNGDGVANLDVTYGCSKYFKKLENMENYIMKAL